MPVRISTAAWGFPEDLQKVGLKGEEPITCRPGMLLPPVDFDQLRREVEQFHEGPDQTDQKRNHQTGSH